MSVVLDHKEMVQSVYPTCFCLDLTMPYNVSPNIHAYNGEYAILVRENPKIDHYTFLSCRCESEERAWEIAWNLISQNMLRRFEGE